jgi:hypothetical protein
MEDPADFSGFQIALWREIAHDLGWEDSDWSFSCVDWTAMIDDLVDPNGACSFAAAGERKWCWGDSDWMFSCVDWTAMIDDLMDASGACSFAAAGERR